MNRKFTWGIVLVPFLCAFEMQKPDDTRPKDRDLVFTIAIKPPNPAGGRAFFQQLEPIQMHFKVELGKFYGVESLLYNDNYPMISNLHVKLTKDGHEVPRTAHAESSRTKTLGRLGKMRNIPAGGSAEGSIILNTIFDMTEIGIYKISVEGKFQSTNQPGEEQIKVLSNEVTIEVKELFIK